LWTYEESEAGSRHAAKHANRRGRVRTLPHRTAHARGPSPSTGSIAANISSSSRSLKTYARLRKAGTRCRRSWHASRRRSPPRWLYEQALVRLAMRMVQRNSVTRTAAYFAGRVARLALVCRCRGRPCRDDSLAPITSAPQPIVSSSATVGAGNAGRGVAIAPKGSNTQLAALYPRWLESSRRAVPNNAGEPGAFRAPRPRPAAAADCLARRPSTAGHFARTPQKLPYSRNV
jgi:hypothetical protein